VKQGSRNQETGFDDSSFANSLKAES